MFYDSGCQDLVSKKEAIDKLEVIGRASSQLPGPITLFGVGNQKSESTHGIYSVRLPLFDGIYSVRLPLFDGIYSVRLPLFDGIYSVRLPLFDGIYSVRLPLFDGRDAVVSGICLDRVTSEFPIYLLKGAVEEDIHKSYRLKGLNIEDLPSLPRRVGGETDLMTGIQYLKYYPEQVFKLASGLTL